MPLLGGALKEYDHFSPDYAAHNFRQDQKCLAHDQKMEHEQEGQRPIRAVPYAADYKFLKVKYKKNTQDT